MTDSFLSVEDINSTLLKYGEVNTLHSIDTSKISVEEFENVLYDFCIVDHSISGSNHTFSFEVKNALWCGGYYFTDADGEYIDSNGTHSDGTITFTTTEDSVILVLYLTNLFTTFNFERLSWVSDDLKNINLFYSSSQTPSFNISMLDDTTASGDVLFTFGSYSETKTIADGKVEYAVTDGSNYFNGIVKVTFDGCSYYIKINFIKDIVPILIRDTVIASKLNTVALDIPDGFYGLETGTVYYNGNEIEVDFINNVFELDLTDKLNNKSVNLSLKVDETETVMEHTYDFIVPCKFMEIDTANALLTELNGSGGSRVMELTEDITLTSDILIKHDAKIIGNNHSINLDEHSFILNEDLTLRIEEVLFSVGNPCIIQRLNSKLTAIGCSFTNCKADDYNNLGSVILCDIDLESLSIDTDFTTIIRNCHFHNNHSCILHGGQLSVTDSTFRNNDLDYVDKNNVAFLHQVDGDANITNNIFDIDYTEDTLCTNQKNIGSAQALFKCGLNAQINTATHEYLSSDEKALFCDAPYNNICHLFAKYYYPEIETCVYSSPTISRENKALCYMITNYNWVFKENVQVTRADADSQNERRTINWED